MCVIALYSLTNFVYLTAVEIVQDGAEVRDDRWGSSTENWQLISSSESSASGPGVKTYMKSYPGIKDTSINKLFCIFSPALSRAPTTSHRMHTAENRHLMNFNNNVIGTQLSAFRGVGTLDVHISIAMGLFCDFNLAYEWVAMLDSIQSYPHVSITNFASFRK